MTETERLTGSHAPGAVSWAANPDGDWPADEMDTCAQVVGRKGPQYPHPPDVHPGGLEPPGPSPHEPDPEANRPRKSLMGEAREANREAGRGVALATGGPSADRGTPCGPGGDPLPPPGATSGAGRVLRTVATRPDSVRVPDHDRALRPIPPRPRPDLDLRPAGAADAPHPLPGLL